MFANPIVYAIIIFLHDLFTVVWIGGMFTLGITVLPAAKDVLGKGPQLKRLMDTIQKRLSVLVYVSIVGLIVTGLLQAKHDPAFQGLFHFGNTFSTILSLKHILIIVMIAISLYRRLVLGTKNGPPTPSQENLKAKLLITNIILGTIVLLLSGFTAALASLPPA
ncbi:MAG: hypothetical protein GXP38_17615 [Chloroflexi bacterium]|nr:hypothetical protein [Chloroflexota bacterium]